jgi:hypothetical protein
MDRHGAKFKYFLSYRTHSVYCLQIKNKAKSNMVVTAIKNIVQFGAHLRNPSISVTSGQAEWRAATRLAITLGDAVSYAAILLIVL